MSFFESPRFPEGISYGALGGPSWMTTVVVGAAGNEQRNARWAYPRHEWDVSQGIRNDVDAATLRAFFMAARGRLHGWRFKDWADFKAAATEGVVVNTTALIGQLVKRYASGSQTLDRRIRKPVVGSVTVFNNGSSTGVASFYTLDTTTGQLAWSSMLTGTITNITVGATTQITIGAGTLSGAVVGDKVYFSGITGADAGLLNLQAFAITAVAGNVYTFAVNTTGKTISISGSATIYYGSRVADLITWSGQFDVPMRFDVDKMDARIQAKNATGFVYDWSAIKIMEILT